MDPDFHGFSASLRAHHSLPLRPIARAERSALPGSWADGAVKSIGAFSRLGQQPCLGNSKQNGLVRLDIARSGVVKWARNENAVP